MIRWIPYVFVRLVIFFIAGILLGIYFPDVIAESIAIKACIASFIVYATSVYFTQFSDRFKVIVPVGLLTVFLAGYVHSLGQTDSRQPDHILTLDKPFSFYKATVVRSPEAKGRSWKLEAAITAVKTEEGWLERNGNVVLYCPRKDSLSVFHYGDVLMVKGTPHRIPPPANPGEFDYRRFMSFRNIYHQDFLKEDDVKLIMHTSSNAILQEAAKARSWCDATLKKYIKGEQERAITSALVLGINDGLDNELVGAYAGTGTLHVLSVSGLHVSIIYLIILFLFKPFKNLKSGKFILAISSILILWLYAFITGLSPSVLRAVTMFSFMAIAKPWGQRMNIYNTLAISAFILLLYDPFLIMSLGFQLSYLAVLGIVYLQPWLYNLWQPEKRLWAEIWKVTTVSIAAQVATFALGLLYFHQFPTYFLISNLLVIPESFAVLILGLSVLTFSFISPVATVLGVVLQYCVKVMNMTVFTIESFPVSQLNGIYISAFQCLLMMFSIVMMLLALKQKKFMYAVAGACSMIVFSSVQWMEFYQRVQVQKLTVYSIKGHSAIDFIDNQRAYFSADTLLVRDKKKIGFHITPNRIFSGVTEVQNGDPPLSGKDFKGCRLTRWKNKNIFYITATTFEFPQSLEVDYCIVANNAIRDIETIHKRLNFKSLVLDGSNSLAFSSRIIKQAKKMKINIHSVLHQGAFVVTI